jgi:hypothetical protein
MMSSYVPEGRSKQNRYHQEGLNQGLLIIKTKIKSPGAVRHMLIL